MNTRHILVFALLAFASFATLLNSKTPADEKIGLDALDGFVGTWVAADENGKPTDVVMSVVRPTAGGSVLMETLFPGTENEMITMYYTREGHLMLTHYCGCTNHPIMKARRGQDGAVHFDCIGTGENFSSCEATPHMHDAVIRFDGDRIKSQWRMQEKGEITHVGDFDMIRRKELPKPKPQSSK
jgi:hypothetical protein